jgi:ketosteroid isomerase-like protein
MSRENIEAVRRVYKAFNRQDADTATELVSPDFTFRSEFGALSGTRYEGRAGFRQYFRDMADVWVSFHLEIEEIEAHGDAVIVSYHEQATGRGSGLEVDARGCEVWHLRDGLPARLDNYPDREQALQALRLGRS